jgi:5-methylcytosine-specific restriction enzyme subunit McrC
MTLPVLTEWRTTEIADLDAGLAHFLRNHCRDYVSIDKDPFDPAGRWRLTPGNWIGSVPLPGGDVLRIRPKMPVPALLRLLDLTYGFNRLHFHPDLSDCDSIEDWFDRLVQHLTHRIQIRVQRGLHRAYIHRRERMTRVRGRLVLRATINRPHDPSLVFDHHEHTADIDDNRILAWTMHCAARCAACSSQTRRRAQALVRTLTRSVELAPCRAVDCIGRTYDRLNQDYAPLHALCRLILNRISPTWDAGDTTSLPFTLDMAALFEEAVACWLDQHVDQQQYRKIAQDRFTLGQATHIAMAADIVIYNRVTGRPLVILDTKYKAVKQPSHEDINQVVTYGAVLGAPQVALIYPQAPVIPTDATTGTPAIRVRSLVFRVDQHPGDSGKQLLESLGIPNKNDA